MRTHSLVFAALTLFACMPAVAQQNQQKAQSQVTQETIQIEPDELMRLHWDKFSVMQREIAKRCLLVHEDGTFRYERATENLGGGGGANAYTGKFSEADVAALKQLLTSPEFNAMQIPQVKRTGTATISADMEMVDYSSPVDQIPQVMIQSVDGSPAIPKQLRKVEDFFKRAEKTKPQAVKGPMQMCLPTDRSIGRDEDPHRIGTPPKQ